VGVHTGKKDKIMARILHPVVFFLVPVLILCGIVAVSTTGELGEGHSVSHYLRQQIVKHANTAEFNVSLADFQGAQFDEIVIFGPYTVQETVDQVLGQPWPAYAHFGLAASDSFHLIVLLRGGKVIKAEQYPRGQGDFVPELLNVRTLKSAAHYHVQRDAAGWLQIALATAKK
jgi:hypothetical protein